MNALVWYGERDVRYEQTAEPKVKDGWVKLKVLATGFCVTEHHIITGKITLCNPPHILGHEICGEIVEVGNGVENDVIGKRVVVETYVGCNECEFCKNGMRHLCDAGEIGYPPFNGGHADYVCVPRSCVHFLPDQISDNEAGIMEAVVCPFGAIMSSNVADKTVLVYGAGVAGLSFIQAAKLYNASKVICVVRNDVKKAQAYHFGADVVIDSSKESVLQRIKEETNGLGVDYFADATGSEKIIAESFNYIKKGGNIILYGLPDKSFSVKLPVFDVILNQINICGYTGNSLAWEKVIEFAKDGKLNLKDMVTTVLPLNQINKAIEILDNKPKDMIKIVLNP
ncbi:MAG: hypothetical protein E7373_01040 [Clostridiales bacterium]|nr:hypothetical protein [Clostridiales bacterium]